VPSSKPKVPGRKLWMVAIPPLLFFVLGSIFFNLEINNWSASGAGLDAVSTPLADFCMSMVFISFVFALIAIPISDQVARKGKSWSAFFWLSIVISPLITWLIASSVNKEEAPSVGVMKTCPKCAEDVKLAAVICKHCGSTFNHETN